MWKTIRKSVTDRFWLRLRHALILISNVRTSASMKMKWMALIWILTVLTTAFKRMEEKFYDFRQTVFEITHSKVWHATSLLWAEFFIEKESWSGHGYLAQMSFNLVTIVEPPGMCYKGGLLTNPWCRQSKQTKCLEYNGGYNHNGKE